VSFAPVAAGGDLESRMKDLASVESMKQCVIRLLLPTITDLTLAICYLLQIESEIPAFSKCPGLKLRSSMQQKHRGVTKSSYT